MDRSMLWLWLFDPYKNRGGIEGPNSEWGDGRQRKERHSEGWKMGQRMKNEAR